VSMVPADAPGSVARASSQPLIGPHGILVKEDPAMALVSNFLSKSMLSAVRPVAAKLECPDPAK
jgi:hypothetical protein